MIKEDLYWPYEIYQIRYRQGFMVIRFIWFLRSLGAMEARSGKERIGLRSWFVDWIWYLENQLKYTRDKLFVLLKTKSSSIILEDSNMIQFLYHGKGKPWLMELDYSGGLESYEVYPVIYRINQTRSANIGWKFMCALKGICLNYKRVNGLFMFGITKPSTSTSKSYNLICFSLVLAVMSQGQLIGKATEMKNGEGTRKWLKISVAHFDNSVLTRSYSKTLIGRCM